jgi:uncharacterized protein (DUF1800 family)
VILLMAAGFAGARPLAAQTAGRDSILHLLNRAAFGPRPGDVERIQAAGIERYLDAQLDPARIGDTAVTRYLARLDVLSKHPDEIGREVRDALAERRTRETRGDTMPMSRADRERSPIRRYGAELQQAAVIRAVTSERQLYEVMADFWVNHFNVFMAKGNQLGFMAAYVEETIRPRVLGRFEDLLVATAKSPAMLFYLDNAQSVAEGAVPPGLTGQRGSGAAGRRRFGRQAARLDSLRRLAEQRMPRGINENYARELLELHTLGVDGGYTQHDVVQVARILTGWSIRRQGDPRFVFNNWAHVTGPKAVMGREFPEDGVNEGMALLAFLARHPSTMRHVSAKLCMRFVSDLPPEGCIDAAVHAWQRTDGDIREVVRAILRSPEFWAPEARGAKLKTPLEFVASAVRAVDGRPDSTVALAALVGRLGQPLYLQAAPTGYPEREESWVNSGALLERFNAAVALAAGRLPGVTYQPDRLVTVAPGPDRLPDLVNEAILSGIAGDSTLATIRRQLADIRDPRAARAFAIGLALGSPEFQRQ